VKYFCNAPSAHPLDFTTDFVQANMPSIPAFDVTNQRPSTVMRTLLSAVNGGFYIAGLAVHAWPNSISEPNQSNPVPLTVGLKTLHTFRRTVDATQLRRRVLVEGRRTSTLIALPTTTNNFTLGLGVPLQDATIFPVMGPTGSFLARVGTQWMNMRHAISVTANGANPPQTKVAVDYAAGSPYLACTPMPIIPPAAGWVRVGNQYSRYDQFTGNSQTENWTLHLPNAVGMPYGVFTANIKVGDTVEWVDCVMAFSASGVWWNLPGQSFVADPDLNPRAQSTDAAVVTLAIAQTGVSGAPDVWPEIEGFVQDGRYSYAGAQSRADSDLENFRDPLASFEWETDDHNAVPGRPQDITMYSDGIVDPVVDATVTILQVDITFPLLTLPPRRRCTGGVVKPSTFMELVVTETN